MRPALRHAIVPAFLFLCLLLGGSPQGVWRNLLLQLFGIGLIGWALLSRREVEIAPFARAILLLAALLLALLLAQLIPLPPGVWSALPGRALAVEGFALRDHPLPWLPLSLTPADTAAALPLLAVPLGLFVAAVRLGAHRRRWLVAALLAGALVSILLGALQVTRGGPYLFAIVNEGLATGLFANVNHQGTLLLAVIPFLATALIGRRGAAERERAGRRLMVGGALAVLILGILLTRSLAAILLAVPVVLASIAMVAGVRARPLLPLAFILLLAGVGALAWSTGAGSADGGITSRTEIYARTLDAVRGSFPVGTGVGSFAEVYRLSEDPGAVDRWFVNHAHSDPLEWLLETGLPGVILLVAFLVVWGRRSWRLWRAPHRDLLALAATIASATILAHSLVDYPVRDAAIQAVFALCLALMANVRRPAASSARAPRHLGLEDDAPLSR